MSQRESIAITVQPGSANTLARPGRLGQPASDRLSWLLFALTCALTAAGLAFLALSWWAPVPDTFAFRGHAALLALAFGVVGQFLVRRRPHNLIGWLFLVAGLAGAVQEFGQEYAAYAFFMQGNALPATRLIAWIASWVFAIGLASIVSVALLFPDGRLPSPRWRPFAWCVTGIWACTIVNSMFKPGPLRFAPYLDNPFPGSQRTWELVMTLAGAALAVSLVIMAASLIARLRRAEGIERQQLKWFTYTAALTCAGGVIYGTGYRTLAVVEPGLTKPIDVLAVVIPSAMPFAVALAILRYRLWDIDLIINRTLVYSALTAGVVAIYFLIVGIFSALLNANANLAAAVATAGLTALLFGPSRARLQRAITPVGQRAREVPGPIQEIVAPKVSGGVALSGWLPWLLFVVTCALSAVDLIFLSLDASVSLPGASRWTLAVFALAFGGVGQLLARKRPQNIIGWLFLLAGVVSAAGASGEEYAAYTVLVHPGVLPGGTLAAWIASWIWISLICISLYILLLFPTGHLPSARWRPVARALAGAGGLMTFTQMFGSGPLRMAPYLDNPFAIPGSGPGMGLLGMVAYTTAIMCQLAAAASVLVRLRRAQGVERQQLKWFAYTAVLVGIVGFLQSAPGSFHLAVPEWWGLFNLLLPVVIVALPFSVGLAILRYRLYDIDRVINHTLVYGALTAGIVALYVLLVGALGALSQTSGNLLISLLATGLIAFLFQPLRERLQRGANRLMYGERDDPYQVLSRLGQRLESTLAPDAMLSTIVETVAQALKLPYAAIELGSGEERALHAEYPYTSSSIARRSGLARFPLTYQQETIGDLLLAPRALGESFSPADLRLLDDFARQAGIAAHAVQLTTALQRSREQLIVAREEERRRIRRDLHDGLGPVLASLAMQADDARQWTHADPGKAEAALADITRKAQEALQDIRRLVYDLRPPALDELGLVGALRQSAANSPNGLHIDIVAPEPLPALPAAVEVAAYRITQETLNNVARHSRARHCRVSISIRDNLRLEIVDDGVGFAPDVRAGVGSFSMRERAAELGGNYAIESERGTGTRVIAELPLTRQEHQDG
jgi:signal transduction histidine kinase